MDVRGTLPGDSPGLGIGIALSSLLLARVFVLNLRPWRDPMGFSLRMEP